MPAPALTVGAITVIPLSDGGFAPPASAMMPNVTAEQWQPVKEHLNADGTIPVNVGSFLIREGDTWTLVDTGLGNRQPAMGGKLLDDLKKAEVTPEQINRVIITHLHLDHIGWNTIDRDGKPEVVFTNARHIVQRKDWEYFAQPDVKKDQPAIALCADPVEAAGLLDLIDGDQSISSGISTLVTPGHTPGHQSILIASGNDKAIILGDVSHTPAQIVNPDWCLSFDVDQKAGAETRGALWDRIEQQGFTICAGHYPAPGIGGIVRVEGKRRWQAIELGVAAD